MDQIFFFQYTITGLLCRSYILENIYKLFQ